MILALDTSGYSQFARGMEAAIRAMESADSLVIPVIVLGELFAGFRRGAREKANRKRLDEFVATFDVEILAISLKEANRYAEIIDGLRTAGKPIPTNDVWIAASALAAGASLLTADRHFDFVVSLDVVRLPVVTD